VFFGSAADMGSMLGMMSGLVWFEWCVRVGLDVDEQIIGVGRCARLCDGGCRWRC
jgi:hypothetical protein